MADVAYQIDLQARAVGVNATAAEVVALANAIDATSQVATSFDGAIAAAKAQLASASQAAAQAAAQLSAAEGTYKGLEREATRAAKAVERAAMKGMDDQGAYLKLARQAQLAAQAVQEQAAVCDQARASASAAATQEQRLAGALGRVEGAAKKAAAGQDAMGQAAKQSAQGFTQSRQSLAQLAGQVSPTAGKFSQMAQSLGTAGVAGAAMIAVAAIAALVVGLGSAAVAAVKYAIANDKIAKQRLDKIAEKAKKNFASLFSGIKTGPLLNAMERLSNLFSANSAAGHALKGLIEKMMNPLISAIEKVEPIAHELWNGLVYGALQVAIMVIKARNAILRIIPESEKSTIRDFIAKLDAMGIAFSAGKVIMYAVAAVLGVIAIAFVAVGATIATVIGFFVGIIYAAGWLIGKLWELAQVAGSAIADFAAWIWDGITSAVDAVTSFVSDTASAIADWVSSAVQAGTDFVMGLAQGIADAASAVVDAAKELATSAVDAVTSALDIGSPSRVMRGKGRNTGQGLALGIEDTEGMVGSAMDSIVGVADAGQAEVARMGGGAQTTTNSTSTSQGGNVYQVTINAPTGDGDDIKRAFLDWLVDEIDGVAVQLGGGQVQVAA